MNPVSARAVLASVLLVVLAGCAGQPEQPAAHVQMSEGDPNSTNPDRIICRQLPPPTGSHISQDEKVCHTWAQWEELEKKSQEAVSRGIHMPGQGGGSAN